MTHKQGYELSIYMFGFGVGKKPAWKISAHFLVHKIGAEKGRRFSYLKQTPTEQTCAHGADW